MLKIERYNHDTNGDPAASFATDAEIEIADQLRRQLEERYLGLSAPSAPLAGAFERRSLIRSTEYRVSVWRDALSES